jgi:glycosyltransferase involved in cell wall biosynthesis
VVAMYKTLKVSVVIPAFNEQTLLAATVVGLPQSVDYIIVVNDASKDNTLDVAQELQAHDSRIIVLDNERNGGIGYSLKRGFEYSLERTAADVVGIVSGDAQCDPSCIEPMLDVFIDRNCDYVKGNRFFQRGALQSMPRYRRIGNIFVSLMAKFSTGYYSVSDITMGFGFLRRSTLEQVNFELVRNRYDYETSMLVALSIVGARIKDFSVPAIYGQETSTVDFWPTVFRVLHALWIGFWQRMYYKYMLFNFHPVVLLLFSGMTLLTVGVSFCTYVLIERVLGNLTPSAGTVMLCVLPLIVGLQLFLTALILDVYNEEKG